MVARLPSVSLLGADRIVRGCAVRGEPSGRTRAKLRIAGSAVIFVRSHTAGAKRHLAVREEVSRPRSIFAQWCQLNDEGRGYDLDKAREDIAISGARPTIPMRENWQVCKVVGMTIFTMRNMSGTVSTS